MSVRESNASRRAFEGVVATCIALNWWGGEAFSVDASLIEADVGKKKRHSEDVRVIIVLISWRTAHQSCNERL
jgi:hypothetical protein